MSGLGPQDIEAMSDPDLEAAYECARRGAKGLPADRLYDGALGMHRLWRGIVKLGIIIADQSERLAAYEDDERARGAEAMGLHPDDSKYNRGARS